MSDFNSLFAQMIEQSQDLAKTLNPALEQFQFPDFTQAIPTMPKEFMEMAFGTTFNPGGLDAKTRLFVTLGGLVAQGSQADQAITMTVRHAIEAGATPQEIAEVIGQMSVFGGVPAMTKAMGLAQEEIARQVEAQDKEQSE